MTIVDQIINAISESVIRVTCAKCLKTVPKGKAKIAKLQWNRNVYLCNDCYDETFTPFTKGRMK